MSVNPSQTTAVNITEQLFKHVSGKHRAVVTTTQAGIVAGLGCIDPDQAPAYAGQWLVVAKEGQQVQAGDVLLEITGTAAEIGIAEDYVLGPIGFASGIATRAKVFSDACPEGLSLACGGWKKLPISLKPLLREALAAVNVLPRLVQGDFVYMSKNAVILLGGVNHAIKAGIAVNHGPVAVQVKTVDEAMFAVNAGAGVIMVDTARLEDLDAVHTTLTQAGVRDRVSLAFGGGVRLEDLAEVHRLGAQAVDVGRAILDAPLLDLRLSIIT